MVIPGMESTKLNAIVPGEHIDHSVLNNPNIPVSENPAPMAVAAYDR